MADPLIPHVRAVKANEPHQTAALDLRRLRDERVPDERGRTPSADPTGRLV